MAATGVTPIPDPNRGRAALQRDLVKVLRSRGLEELGWQQPNDLTLLIPMTAQGANAANDEYLLRLHFDCYPEWPPSALFVNPETFNYEHRPEDVVWLPRIEGNQQIAVHQNYSQRSQLICCSTTLEFYLMNHSVKAEHVWDANRQNFNATISAIRHGLCPLFYKGRQVYQP